MALYEPQEQLIPLSTPRSRESHSERVASQMEQVEAALADGSIWKTPSIREQLASGLDGLEGGDTHRE